jgi:hypothetical protein
MQQAQLASCAAGGVCVRRNSNDSAQQLGAQQSSCVDPLTRFSSNWDLDRGGSTASAVFLYML